MSGAAPPPRQATHNAEGATNSAIAARPGLPVFLKALELVQGRDVDTSTAVMKVSLHGWVGGACIVGAGGWTCAGQPSPVGSSRSRSQLVGPIWRPVAAPATLRQVIARTGPNLLTDALVAAGLQRTAGMFGKQYEVDGAGELWDGPELS